MATLSVKLCAAPGANETITNASVQKKRRTYRAGKTWLLPAEIRGFLSIRRLSRWGGRDDISVIVYTDSLSVDNASGK
jgi:hypothetical protein